MVGLSPAATLHRVRALKESGVIRIIRAQLDPAAAGFPLQLYVFATLGRHDPRATRIFEDQIRALPQIIAADNVAGEMDYLLTVVARDVAELQEVLTRLSTRGGQRLVTYLRLAEVKPPCRLPLDPDTTPVAARRVTAGGHPRTGENRLVKARQPGQALSWSILSRNSVVAIVALRGWPRRNASANFLACSYSTLPGIGGSSGLTFTSTSAGPGVAERLADRVRTSRGLGHLERRARRWPWRRPA